MIFSARWERVLINYKKMIKIFEVTTIAGRIQRYEEIKVSPIKFADNSPGVQIESLTRKKGDSINDELATHAHSAYSLTGLDGVIKKFPGVEEPERLRLIYDVFPNNCSVPILRVCPTEGEIVIAKYDFKKAKLHLERMTFTNEFEGSLGLEYTGLRVFLHLRNFEKENEDYYGRLLKKSMKIR